MVKLYQSLFDTHSKKYGPDTCIFLMVGGFYELYCWIQESGEHSNSAARAMGIMNIAIKDKQNYGPKKEPGLWGGVPIESLHKFAQVLTREGWTVVVVDQLKESIGRSGIQRVPVRILSPGTHIEIASADRMCVAALVSMDSTYATSVADITTGEVFSFETKEPDQILHMFQVYGVKEVIACAQPPSEPLDLLGSRGVFHKIPWNSQSPFWQPLVREEFLGKAFKIRSLLPIRSWLGLGSDSNSVEISLCFLIQMIQDHFPQGAERLLSHELYNPITYMRLCNNILEQINMTTTNGKKSILSLLERTHSAVGKRALKERILRPLADTVQIQERWNQVAWASQVAAPLRKAVEKELRRLLDLPRLHRALAEGSIDSGDVVHLFQTYSATECLIQILEGSPLACDEILADAIKTYRTLMVTHLDLEKAKRREEGEPVGVLTQSSGLRSAAIESHIDQLRADWMAVWQSFGQIFPIQTHSFTLVKKPDGEWIWQGPRAALKALHDIQTIGLNKGCNLTNLEISAKTAGPISLSCKEFELFKQGLEKAVRSLTSAMKEEIAETCDLLWDSVRMIHSQWTDWLGSIDVTFALASAAMEYKWTKPNLGDILQVQGLRHPLLELATTRAEYVKHTVKLGSSGGPNGMLLYGVNASGKSSLMKSLGISILLAQAGSFVPADSLTLRPYDAAFSRIWSHDNVWAGLSSFAVEVGELRDILQLATERSLILGDEVCSGTESLSATALVASTLEHLDGLGAHFIFATHLHGLLQVPGLLPRPGIGVWHLRVHREASGKLVYDRSLQEGPGASSYGLDVAKAMGLPLTLMERAFAIRRALEGSVTLSEAPRSSWNTQIAREQCEVCGHAAVRDLEVHHRTPRAEGGGNELRNLVVLCETCHDDHHRGNLSIGELKQTSEGLERETVRTESITISKAKAHERSVEEIETINATLETFKGRPVGRLVTALEQAGITMTPAEVKKWIKKRSE